MKKILLAVTILLASVSAMAQGQGQRREFNLEQNATRQADRIKETCKTSDEQYKKLYDLFLAEANRQKAQMDSLRAAGAQGGGMRGNFNREEMQKRRDEQAAKIKAILTPEQYAAYEEAQKQMQERRRERGGQGGFGGGFGRRQGQN